MTKDDAFDDAAPPPYQPPPYQAQSQPDDPQDDPLVEPTVFILAGQSVHAENVSSPPAYALSRAVATLTKSTEKVEFERLDTVLASSGAVRHRSRHLYDLRRSVKQPRIGFSRARAASDAPEYYLHSQSPRRTLGHVGLAKARRGGFAAGFRALPVVVPAATTSRARFGGDGDGELPAFELRRAGDRSRWVVGGGGEEEKKEEDAAVVAIEDAADEQRRLILTRALPRKQVDVLVALWCCSIWQEAAEREARREITGNSFMKKMDAGRGIFFGTDIY
ncbi:hypothetical protein ISF_08405 [Cordyceps fumosorosea ARSEF 2679]|uniref:Uncharacterized protein n=1 Tax=Cordyceps fumosorosea (strain ARSEF 2679) TaxID=1081104 RepID=A0A167MBV9_CORFA|nr:hypothetical protein ISF_08405 [Cordyceps fumosorosea ARSEF 2679]OAA54178.1 hypothetical protein ISF_08405 [Cordyceps fumosorosea ARSEF 2679]